MLSLTQAVKGRGAFDENKMDENFYDGGSGLELVHISDVLDYLGEPL